MITDELKTRVDNLWDVVSQEGISNPLTTIEQITFLIFSRLLDIAETRTEKLPNIADGILIFKGIFRLDQQHLRWSHFKQLGADEMLRVIRDEVFPHFGTINEIHTKSGFRSTELHEYFKDIELLVKNPSRLESTVNMIDQLPLTESRVKADTYEYLLSKVSTTSINAQFSTPRHITRLMVEIIDPRATEMICDPACGPGGFLAASMEHFGKRAALQEAFLNWTQKRDIASLKQIVDEHKIRDISSRQYPHKNTPENDTIHGFDFNTSMLRIATVNLLLHGLDAPRIHYQNTLHNNFTEQFQDKSSDAFDVILSTPPFGGRLDEKIIDPSLLRQVKTTTTELLFLALALRMLKNGGRCALIVRDGMLFGSSKAHQTMRKILIEENQLEAVISLPSGVFLPDTTIATAILVFTKGGSTDNVFFYHLQDDGFSLDHKRTRLYDSDFSGDLPDALARWNDRHSMGEITDRTAKAFSVPTEEIAANKYNLSLNRYMEQVYEPEEYDPPREILKRLKDLEMEIERGLEDLEGML